MPINIRFNRLTLCRWASTGRPAQRLFVSSLHDPRPFIVAGLYRLSRARVIVCSLLFSLFERSSPTEGNHLTILRPTVTMKLEASDHAVTPSPFTLYLLRHSPFSSVGPPHSKISCLTHLHLFHTLPYMHQPCPALRNRQQHHIGMYYTVFFRMSRRIQRNR